MIRIQQDNRVYEKFFKTIAHNFTRRNKINEIVIHGTAGGVSAQAVINWMLSGERMTEYMNGIALFHYIIDKNGAIYQIIPDEYFVFHSEAGHHDEDTIGIELLNSDRNNAAPYSVFQYNSLFNLIKQKKLEYPLEIITSHKANRAKYSGGLRVCPGPRFDWALLSNNFNFEKIAEETYKFID